MNEQADFFIAGGTLRSQTRSYVTRPADQDLYERVLAGEFCYVLTPRQMGKSSLMVRTARRLKDAGVTSVIVDLTSIGTASVDEWYLGLLTRIRSGLGLGVDPQTWWREHGDLGEPQRFTAFLHDVALAQAANPVAIFIDEIDSTLNLSFRDDFFAAIRAIYNARASDPVYNRLTFVLLGVATPTDLIQSRERTPFNIGRRIMLQEFSYADAAPLREGLEIYQPGQGDAILRRIFHWTNGHPYLTQKLCLAAAREKTREWDDAKVDTLVEASFFADDARKNTNLTFVEDRVRTCPQPLRRSLLRLYSDVYGGKEVRDDDRSQVQNYLELFGLVRVERGKLRVRNQIYQRVFDRDWIRANMPANAQRNVAIVASLVTAALVAIVAYLLSTGTPESVQAQLCEERFLTNSASAVRIDTLSCLFSLQPGQDQYDEQALRLFYDGLTPADQQYLFLLDDAPSVGQQIVTAVRGIYVTLKAQPGSSDQDRPLMEAMVKALRDSQQGDATTLSAELESWMEGRRLAGARNYIEATRAYSAVIESNQNHTAARYDRALAYIELGEYDRALTDLDEMIRIAEMVAPTATPATTSAPTGTALPATRTDISIVTAAPPAATRQVATGQPAGAEVTPAAPTSATTSATPAPAASPTSPALSTISRFVSPEQIVDTVRETILSSQNLLQLFGERTSRYQQLDAKLFDLTLALQNTQIAQLAAQQSAQLAAQQTQISSSQQTATALVATLNAMGTITSETPGATDFVPSSPEPPSPIATPTRTTAPTPTRAATATSTPDANPVTYRVDVVKISLAEITALPGCEELATSSTHSEINNACIVGPGGLEIYLFNFDVNGIFGPIPSDARQLFLNQGQRTRITVESDPSGQTVRTTGNNNVVPEEGAYYAIRIAKVEPQ